MIRFIRLGKNYRNIMRCLFLLPAFFLLFTSCHEEIDPNYACSVEDPLNNLDWLAERIREMEESTLSSYFYVSMARYRSKTVFVFKNCCPFCATVTPVVDCSGEEIGHLGSIDPSKLKDEVIIWEGEDFACNPPASS
ncbi:hypothetical protein [Negadavirga shengliensis]|uniref:Uncharacterized protein n=1 Tax=Negadavirga shengliensis TaxID=1389218 RepID=A0ABV9T4W8_9BACT